MMFLIMSFDMLANNLFSLGMDKRRLLLTGHEQVVLSLSSPTQSDGAPDQRR